MKILELYDHAHISGYSGIRSFPALWWSVLERQHKLCVTLFSWNTTLSYFVHGMYMKPIEHYHVIFNKATILCMDR